MYHTEIRSYFNLTLLRSPLEPINFKDISPDPSYRIPLLFRFRARASFTTTIHSHPRFSETLIVLVVARHGDS